MLIQKPAGNRLAMAERVHSQPVVRDGLGTGHRREFRRGAVLGPGW